MSNNIEVINEKLLELSLKKYKLNQLIKKLDTEISIVKSSMYSHIKNNNINSETSFVLSSGKITIKPTMSPVVKDWDKVYEYVTKEQAFHLLKREIKSEPWREMIDNHGLLLPGTEEYNSHKITITPKKK